MSWGVVSTSATDLHLDHRIAEAEIACKTAKDRGRGRVEVYQDTDQSMIRRHDEIGLIGSVREALRLERIVVYAQPITPLINHSLPTTYELLVRIVDAKGNIVEAAEFMSAATRYQILPEIDRAVCERAFEQLSKNTSSSGPLHVSINLSGPTLSDPDFLEWLLASMAKYGIDGTCLVFEITEAAAAANLQQVQQFIRRLTSHGVRFALDDFGTGVSSLAYLKNLEINTIKLDGSYVVDVLTNPRSQALVRAIVQLADAMGITTVAEFVESNTVRDRLASLGIQFGQGYALGRPGPLDDVIAALADRAPEWPRAAVHREQGVHHAVRHSHHVQARVNGDTPHFLANWAAPGFSRAAYADQRLTQTCFARPPLNPVRIAKGALPIDAGANGLHFCRRLRQVHQITPIGR